MNDDELRAALETYHRESYGWALGCCARSAVEADAVLQTVYLKVLAGEARYDGRASFKTWLFAVIRRTAADERRRQFVRRLLLAQRPAPASVSERPDDVLYRAELARLLRDELARLPQRQREVLQLVFYHDLSLAEAAQVLGISSGAAHQHYDRGKQKVRAQLEEWRFHEQAGRTDAERNISATETSR